MYRLQWANVYRKSGELINPKKYKYQDTIFIYENREDAEIARIDMLRAETGSDAKYIRVVEV